MVRLLAHPVAEGRPEPVRRIWLAHFPEQLGQRLIRQRAIAPHAGKDKVATLDAEPRAALDDTKGAAGEGTDMLPLGLHAVLGELPQAPFPLEIGRASCRERGLQAV